MKIVFIRHGEPDYDKLKKMDLSMISKNIAPLTDLGIESAKRVSYEEIIKDADIILSSPYTRALQTSYIINERLNKKIVVEPDLREWECEIDYNPFDKKLEKRIEKEFHLFNGEHTSNCKYNWESLSNLGNRAINVIKKYNNYNKIIVVTHAMLIRQFYYDPVIEYCFPIIVEYSNNMKLTGYYKE